MADELLAAADRVGWRGNTSAWVTRARVFVRECDDEESLRRLAPAVDSWRLLRPSMACLVPLHRWGTFSAVWQDARHVVVRSVCAATLTTEQRDVWIGCLAYIIRHPCGARMGRRAALALRPPPGALQRARQDACWAPVGPHTVEPTRTRTIMILIHADRSATEPELHHATRWVEEQPRQHRTRALESLMYNPRTD